VEVHDTVSVQILEGDMAASYLRQAAFQRQGAVHAPLDHRVEIISGRVPRSVAIASVEANERIRQFSNHQQRAIASSFEPLSSSSHIRTTENQHRAIGVVNVWQPLRGFGFISMTSPPQTLPLPTSSPSLTNSKKKAISPSINTSANTNTNTALTSSSTPNSSKNATPALSSSGSDKSLIANSAHSLTSSNNIYCRSSNVIPIGDTGSRQLIVGTRVEFTPFWNKKRQQWIAHVPTTTSFITIHVRLTFAIVLCLLLMQEVAVIPPTSS
jgi:hypothetical protein